MISENAVSFGAPKASKAQHQLTIVDAGVMEYGAAWELQSRLHSRSVLDGQNAYLMIVEHPPVITLGKNASERFLLSGETWLKRIGVGLYRSDRGGEATAHNPGQMVAYPIIPLPAFGLGARAYVQRLEQAVIDTLAGAGVPAGTDPVHPGVWVGNDKVCAVGTRIKDRVTMHGIALNVDNDLSIFNLIVPCGITGRGVTSFAQILGNPPSMHQVKADFIKAFARLFDCEPAFASVDEF